jgi:drug/metabolite transporter (DMT)-like permease
VTRRGPLLALVGVTAIWGVTFVQVQDALALYPLFAFLAVRFAISTLALAPFAWRSLRTLPREGYIAGIGVGTLLAAAYGLQTAGLELTTVASTGFITGLYVVFTPLLALVLFGTRVPRALWAGVVLAVIGLLLLSGVPGGSALGNALVLGNAVFQSFQITAMERYAPRYDPRALTFLQMATSFVGFTIIATSLGQLEVPRGGTVWGALLVTGLFAGALGYLIATWVQSQTTAARAALVFTLEAPFAALFGVLLANEVLPTLSAPPGWDLPRYADQVLSRFANRTLGYTCEKVAADGSQKLPVRLVPTIRARLAAGAAAPRCAQVLAAWVTCMAGPRSAAFAIDDAALAVHSAHARRGATDPEQATETLLGCPGFLEPRDQLERAFRVTVLEQVRPLWRADGRAVLAQLDPRRAAGSPVRGGSA